MYCCLVKLFSPNLCQRNRFISNRALSLCRFCVLLSILPIIIEDVADYVEEIRPARCRQAIEGRTENEGNSLKHLTSD